MDQFTLFDVGANWGADCLDITRNNPHYRAYAFEPTPELYVHLMQQSAPFRERFSAIPSAVSDFNGVAKFNITAHADWGCSSLLEFADGLDVTWPDRTDFFYETSLVVPVIRLDTWLEVVKINKIDFFHCDTQGSDLAVLRGMADYFALIQEGVIEVPQSEEVMLYKGQHTMEEALDFLSDKGYEVFKTMKQQNEDNIYFRPIK
jgi:FkbM family methyltransferase